MTEKNGQWIYSKDVDGPIDVDNFSYREAPLPKPGLGQTLVRVNLVSIDPANRNWILRPSYVPQVEVGNLMGAFAVGEVIESNDPYRFNKGDIIHGNLGWQQYALVNSYDRQEYVHVCSPGHSLEESIGVLGITGMTAYFGLRKLAPFKEGETIVVAGATGGCGSILGQLAKLRGCRVIGFAGGAEKCRWLVDELAFDGAIDYMGDNVFEDLEIQCPDGVDAFSDGVGGIVTAATYALLKQNSRLLNYGNITAYNQHTAQHFKTRTTNLGRTEGHERLLDERNVRQEFLMVFDDYCDRLTAEAEMVDLMKAGKLKAPATVIEGIENLPSSLVGVYGAASRNRYGKLSVRVG
jgi:NADPH-dependent curcumin reductase CurA